MLRWWISIEIPLDAQAGLLNADLLKQTLPVLAIDREEDMSLQPADQPDHHENDHTRAKRPYVALELKKLSPKAALEWLESHSSSIDRATSEQIEELKQHVRALIPPR
jgi:hypothetical protein